MKMTKSHPVARAMKRGMSLKAAWASYRGGRSGRRKSRRARSSNPLLRLTNPIPGLGKITATARQAVSRENLAKGAAVGATIIASWVAPAKLLPAHDTGWKGVGLTAGAGALAALLIGAVRPGLAPIALAAAIGGAVVKAGLPIVQGFVMGDFLTLKGLGQLPAGLIQGGQGGVGDFMTVNKPFAALPGGGLGSGQRFSPVY